MRCIMQRMLLTLGTLATGGAVYLGALNLRTAVIGSVDLLFSSQRYDMSFRFTRRTATVTTSAPDAVWQAAISPLLRYFPVPTNRRDAKRRPAISIPSDMPLFYRSGHPVTIRMNLSQNILRAT